MQSENLRFLDEPVKWLVSHGLRIGLIFLITAIVLKVGSKFITDIITRTVDKRYKNAPKRSRELRKETIKKTVNSLYRVLLIFLAAILALSVLGIDLWPLLAGAGILSFAVGFGSQSLVKDVISGLFILFENQYRVGDVVDINGSVGRVESMTLRVTIIRTLNGDVHYVPNGTILTTINKTQKYSNIDVTFKVAPGTDIDKAGKLINTIGRQLAGQKHFKDMIIEAPAFKAVQDLDGGNAELLVIGKTKTGKQWEVNSEIRKQVFKKFKDAELELK